MEDVTPQAAKEAEQVMCRWWRYWTAAPGAGEPSRKGELAQLRRCKTVEEIFFTAPYHNLYRQVATPDWCDKERIAVIAGLLAHVKTEAVEKKVAKHFASAREGSEKSPRVSEMRFMRLMKIENQHELFPALVRLIHLAGDSAPLEDLITSVYNWNDKKRREWIFQYYEKLPDKANPIPL